MWTGELQCTIPIIPISAGLPPPAPAPLLPSNPQGRWRGAAAPTAAAAAALFSALVRHHAAR